MIEDTLIHFKTKTAFNTELEAGNIKDTSVVFIKETLEIYTHGTLYSLKDVLDEAKQYTDDELLNHLLSFKEYVDNELDTKADKNNLTKNPYDLYPLGTIIESTENPDPERWHACDASVYEGDTEVDLPMIPIENAVQFGNSSIQYWEYKKVFVRKSGNTLLESTNGSTWTSMSEFTYDPPTTTLTYYIHSFKIINNQFVIISYCDNGNYRYYYAQIYTLNEDNLLIRRCNHTIESYKIDLVNTGVKVFAIQWKPNESIVAGFFYAGNGTYAPIYMLKEISMVSYEIISKISSNYTDKTVTLSSIVYRDGVISYYHSGYNDYYLFSSKWGGLANMNVYGSYYYKDGVQRKAFNQTSVFNNNIIAYTNLSTITVYSNMHSYVKIQSLPPCSNLYTYSNNTCKVYNIGSSGSNLFYWIRDSKFVGPFEIENEKILAPDTMTFYQYNIIHHDDDYMYFENGYKLAYIRYIPYIKNSYIKLK